MDFVNASNPVKASRGARPVDGIGSEEDLVMSLALTMGLDRVTTGQQQVAFDIRLQDADPVRLAAIATVIRTPQVRRMVDNAVPRFEKNLADVHRAALAQWSAKPTEGERRRRLRYCESLCTKDMSLLPQGWSIRHLWDRGTEFVASFDQSEERYCAEAMARYASRKSQMTSLLAFFFGAALALVAHQLQLV